MPGTKEKGRALRGTPTPQQSMPCGHPRVAAAGLWRKNAFGPCFIQRLLGAHEQGSILMQ